MNTLLKNFVLFWNKESLGFLLSNRYFFSVLKQTFPNSKITLLVSKNILHLVQNNGIKEALGLLKNDQILSVPQFILSKSVKYDVAISPTMKNYSIANHLLLKAVSAELKIGFSIVNENKNPYKFIFNRQVTFNWRLSPDVHFSEISLQLLKSMGIEVRNKFHLLKFYSIDNKKKSEVIKKFGIGSDQKLIGINNSPEDLLNKWDSEKLLQLITSLCDSGKYFFYFIGERLEANIENKLRKSQQIIPVVEKDNFSEMVELFSASNLVITCDSRVMHMAGFTNVNQISLFGVRNPFNWAPLGNNKKFISKSDLINDISPEEVFELSKTLIGKEN